MMVRLDKLRFARLIAFVQMCSIRALEGNEIAKIDDLCGFEAQDANTNFELGDVNSLLSNINKDGGLIAAIKAYRALTGLGLKEAKDAIEAVRNVKRD